jgi:hypothetical protein
VSSSSRRGGRHEVPRQFFFQCTTILVLENVANYSNWHWNSCDRHHVLPHLVPELGNVAFTNRRLLEQAYKIGVVTVEKVVQKSLVSTIWGNVNFITACLVVCCLMLCDTPHIVSTLMYFGVSHRANNSHSVTGYSPPCSVRTKGDFPVMWLIHLPVRSSIPPLAVRIWKLRLQDLNVIMACVALWPGSTVAKLPVCCDGFCYTVTSKCCTRVNEVCNKHIQCCSCCSRSCDGNRCQN